MTVIQRERIESVTVLRLEHGKANALDLELLEALGAELDAARSVAPPHALVLTGAGSSFSAGVDLFRIVEGDRSYGERFLAALDATLRQLVELPLPVVAAVNGPRSVVLSGTDEAVRRVLVALGAASHRFLNVSHAFHSPHMRPAFETVLSAAERAGLRPPKIPIVTTLTGNIATATHLCSAQHWAHHVVQPVRFLESVRTLER